jgi:hypothetical protein
MQLFELGRFLQEAAPISLVLGTGNFLAASSEFGAGTEMARWAAADEY